MEVALTLAVGAVILALIIVAGRRWSQAGRLRCMYAGDSGRSLHGAVGEQGRQR